MFKLKPVFAAVLMTASLPMLATAAELHAGDVELEIASGKLVAHGAAQTQFGTGYAIFESDFGDFANGPYKTDDPGYDSQVGTFTSGAIINYQALGNLSFWNGTSWANSVANGEILLLDGNLGEETTWTVSGVTGATSGLVGQAGTDGKIHEHLDMSIKAPTATLPTVGAYFVTLQLTSTNYASSDPYLIVFNNGLGEAAFENAIQALAVPEADTYAMLLAGLGLMGFKLRRLS